MQALVVTGLGVVSPLGLGRAAWCESLRDPRAAEARAFGGAGAARTVLTADKYPEARAAEVWGFDAKKHLGEKGLRNFDRLTKQMIVAAKLALEDAGIKANGAFIEPGVVGPESVGIVSSTAYGSLDAITELNLVAELEDPRYLNPARFPNTVINAAAGYVSIWEDLRAPNVTIVDGNCGALDAVLTAETHLAHRRADVFLVGGGEVVSEPLYLAFRKLGVVVEDGAQSRPGDPHSAGMRIGEGAAYLCVERRDGARARGARVLGRVVGYGTAFEPPQSEALLIHVSADAVASAIRAALLDAAIESDDVDVVCAAASGIARIDESELEGIGRVFGAGTPIAAPKALYGETSGAAGALGMAAALAWLGGEAAPAPIVRGTPGPGIGERGVSNAVVVTAVGYYGNVSAVVLAPEGWRE